MLTIAAAAMADPKLGADDRLMSAFAHSVVAYLAFVDDSRDDVLLVVLPELAPAIFRIPAALDHLGPLLNFAMPDPDLAIRVAAGLILAGVPVENLDRVFQIAGYDLHSSLVAAAEWEPLGWQSPAVARVSTALGRLKPPVRA